MKSDRRNGSTLIEFAFVLLPLLALIFGGIEMDRMLLAYNALTDSARAGVRYAAVHGTYADGADYCNQTKVTNVVKTFAGMGMLDASKPTFKVTVKCADWAAADGTVVPGTAGHIGSPIFVTVEYPYDPFTTFFPSLSITLGSTAKGTITY